MTAYCYPSTFEPYRHILCSEQLCRELESNEIGLENPFQLRSKMKGTKYLDFGCRTRYCPAIMKYELNQNKLYELIEKNNKHNHPIDEKLSKPEKSKTTKYAPQFIYQINTIYVTKEMQVYYSKYNRCMYLTITKAKNLFMLVFSCVLPNKDIGIFSIVLFETPTTNLVRKNLKQFKNRKKHQLPETIICNNKQVAQVAKQTFPTANFIMIDQEISYNYKVRYGFTKLTETVTSETDWDKQHRKLVTYVRESISPAEICSVFENYKKLCFPFLPLTFVGLGVHLFHPLVLQQISEENHYFAEDSTQFLVHFPHKIKTQFHDSETKNFIQQIGISNDNLLLGVYTELEESVVKFLSSQQNKTFFCDLVALPNGEFEVRYKLIKASRVRKNQKKWQCDCGLIIKTGLPCCHIMKVLLTLEEEIKPYISSYWLPSRDPKQIIQSLSMKS